MVYPTFRLQTHPYCSKWIQNPRPVQNALVTHQSKTTGSWLDLIDLTSKQSSFAKYCNSSNLFTKPNRNWWQRESHLSEPINCRCLSASYVHSTWGTPKITLLFAPKDIFPRVFLWVKTRVGPKKPGILTKGWPTKNVVPDITKTPLKSQDVRFDCWDFEWYGEKAGESAFRELMWSLGTGMITFRSNMAGSKLVTCCKAIGSGYMF